MVNGGPQSLFFRIGRAIGRLLNEPPAVMPLPAPAQPRPVEGEVVEDAGGRVFVHCYLFSLKIPFCYVSRDGELQDVDDVPPFRPHLTDSHNLGFEIRPENALEWSAYRDDARGTEVGMFPRMVAMPFYATMRRIMEDPTAPLAEKLARSRAVIEQVPDFRVIVAAYGGVEALLDRAYPHFADELPVPRRVRANITALGIDCPALLETTPDDALLALDGIGKKVLARLRAFQATWPGDPAEARTALCCLLRQCGNHAG